MGYTRGKRKPKNMNRGLVGIEDRHMGRTDCRSGRDWG